MREMFALIRNVDETILQLNEHLDNCQFQKINLSTFEKCFSGILNLPKYYIPTNIVQLESGQNISGEFFKSLQNNPVFGRDALMRKYIILLRYDKTYEVETTKEGELEVQKSMNFFADFQRFNSHLFRCLKLTFSGDFDLDPYIIFEYENSDNSILTKLESGFFSRGRNTLTIEQNKIGEFLDLLKSDIDENASYSLALSNFETSFAVDKPQAKFVNLITALESIFNASSNQISHTFSRHLSLLISESESEFQVNYKKIKKLYNKRSALVHGDKQLVDDVDIQFA